MNEYLTYKEAAEFARCKPTKIRRYVKAGELPMRRVGRTPLIYRPALERWMQRDHPVARAPIVKP